MPQSITLDERRHNLDSSTGEFVVPDHGDTARGLRHDIAGVHADGDFASGMRTMPRTTSLGDFASGMRTMPRIISRGDFATGMRDHSAPVIVEAFTSAGSALPIAA